MKVVGEYSRGESKKGFKVLWNSVQSLNYDEEVFDIKYVVVVVVVAG